MHILGRRISVLAWLLSPRLVVQCTYWARALQVSRRLPFQCTYSLAYSRAPSRCRSSSTYGSVILGSRSYGIHGPHISTSRRIWVHLTYILVRRSYNQLNRADNPAAIPFLGAHSVGRIHRLTIRCIHWSLRPSIFCRKVSWAGHITSRVGIEYVFQILGLVPNRHVLGPLVHPA